MNLQYELLISTCGQAQFTCGDGTCLPKSQRCNLVNECPDQTDEKDCQLLIVPADYSVELPPPKIDENAIPINFSLIITSVSEFDLLEFTIALDLTMILVWKDPRIFLKQLRPNAEQNIIEDPYSLWVPSLKIKDGSGSLADLTMRGSQMTVRREGFPLPDDDTKLSEGI